MRAGELVELAAHVARHAPLLIQGGQLPTSSLDEYWLAAKCRFERWAHAIRRYKDAYACAPKEKRPSLWPAQQPTVEEVLLSDVMARVWGGAAAAADRLLGERNAEPVVRSVLLDQMEARHRVLRLLVDHHDLPRRAVASLNQLRRRTERWTDYLLAPILVNVDVADYAVDPTRAREFAADLAACDSPEQREQAWKLSLVSLRGSFGRGLSPAIANPELNTRVAASIVGCFPPETFEAAGILPTLWLARLAHACSDVESLVASALVV